MGCFCHASVAPLGNLLGQLRASGLVSVQAGVAAPALRGANIASALAAWLAQHGLPAAPWAPDPSWLNTPLPQVPLSLHQVATISALAQLQAQSMSQLGINLMQPAGVHAFARVIATLQARLAAIAALPGMGAFSAAPLLRLAASMNAITQVQAALQAGVLPPSPAQLTAFSMPGGLPMARWTSFLAQLRKLAAMIAAAAHLNVSLSDTTALSAAVRALARIQLPTIPPAQAQLMAQLTSTLSAQASLQAALGIAPGSMSLPQLTAMVQARLNAMLTAVAQAFGMSLRGLTPEAALAALMGLLPKMPPAPTSFATPAVVSAALNAHALTNLNWNVPPILPSTQIGLPANAFAAQLATALNLKPVLPSPCASGCDAARIMRGLAQMTGA
jgi:hypothetical protein